MSRTTPTTHIPTQLPRARRKDLPLTDEEKAATIDVDVWVSETWTITHREGWSASEWRDMLREVHAGTADEEEYIDGAMLEKDVTITLRDAPEWVTKGLPSPDEEDDIDPELAEFMPKRIPVSDKQESLL